MISIAGEHAASHAVLRAGWPWRMEAAEATRATPHPSSSVWVPGHAMSWAPSRSPSPRRRGGLPVLYLGPDLPPESWTAAAVSRSARAAVVGVPTPSDVRSAVAVLSALREAAPSMVLAVGGDEAARIAGSAGAIELPPRLPEAVTMLQEAIGLRPDGSAAD